jgi:2-methylcitrate dehydratase PrpD
MPTLTERLAQKLAAPVAESDRKVAALRLLDWTGCAVAALGEPLADLLRRAVAAMDAGGQACRVGAGSSDPMAALLWNGGLGNVLEMDDVHRASVLHPGPVVIPAALTAAQCAGASSSTFLDAIVRGYEATIRVGTALGTSHYRHWHTTATAGSFGAAAAAASVLGLDAEGTADALGTAGSTTGGLWQVRHEDVPTKSIHNAESARRGYTAAFLARAGLRGPRAILEGPQGLFAATAPDADLEGLLADTPGWRIHETSIKPWPACRHTHPMIDALREALKHVNGATVEAVSVFTYADALRFCDRPDPQTPAQARFSLQHAAAVVLARGEPRLPDFGPAALVDPTLKALRARVEVSEDPGITRAYPAHFGAKVRLKMASGDVMEASVIDALGDPEWPLSTDQIRSKALNLMAAGGFDPARAAALAAAALSMAEGAALSDYLGLLGAPQ